jgi:hypothetical protein
MEEGDAEKNYHFPHNRSDFTKIEETASSALKGENSVIIADSRFNKSTETSPKAHQLRLGAQAQIELRNPKMPKNDPWILNPD